MTSEEFAPLFGTRAVELRFDLAGRAAVRVAGGPVAPRHVEPVPPAAAWLLEARCGTATAWLLADAPPSDAERAAALLREAAQRHAALALQDHARDRDVLLAELLERLTHRLRTDVTTLQAVADGMLGELFEPEDLQALPGELDRTARAALRRIVEAREVMSALAPHDGYAPEPIVETLRDELEAAGRDGVDVTGPPGERPLAAAGWGPCARALAASERLTAFAVEPDPRGWRISAGRPGTPIPWTRQELGDLVHAGYLAVAAGGSAAAERGAQDAISVELTLPAAPPSGGSDGLSGEQAP